MKVTQNHPTPLYHQIYLVILDMIVNGVLADNETLPSEGELSQMFQVSRITVRRALSELAKDGLVSRERGRGTVVHYRPPLPLSHQTFAWARPDKIETGLVQDIVSRDYRPATNVIARELGIPPGDIVRHDLKLWRDDISPIASVAIYLPEKVGRQLDEQVEDQSSLDKALMELGYNVHEAEQYITAILADPFLAGLLEVALGGPLLRISRMVSDAKGVPFRLVQITARTDRYRCSMPMEAQVRPKAP